MPGIRAFFNAADVAKAGKAADKAAGAAPAVTAAATGSEKSEAGEPDIKPDLKTQKPLIFRLGRPSQQETPTPLMPR